MNPHVILELLGRVAMVFSVGCVLALAWLLPHRGFHLLRAPAGRAAQDPRLAGLRRRAPAFFDFIARHFQDARPSWLRAVLGGGIFVAGAIWFTRLLRGVLADGKIVTADHCLHNTVATFHSPGLIHFYSAVTNLASPAFAGPLVAVLAAVLWTAARRREALGLLLALAGSLAIAVIFKWTVERPRPVEAQALFRDSSFPSGHTLIGTAVYGFLVYLILRDETRRAWNWLLALPLLFLIGAVPLSRIYLGMHWPYDTVASQALAGAWLAVLITLFKFPPLVRRLAPTPPPTWLPRALAGAVAALLVYAAVLIDAVPHAKLAPPPLPAPLQVPLAVLGAAYPTNLPQTSQDAVGGLMEPISLEFVGDRQHIVDAFRRAGWHLADPPSVHGLLRELSDVIADRPDLQGPATPAFFAGLPQNLTFEKPGDASGSIRRRHHTRLWQTTLCAAPACTPLWVATASYDRGIKWVAEPYLLTHRIDPQVDHERDLIAHELTLAGARPLTTLLVTGPRTGHNAGGDGFVTDGRAHLFLCS
jgi:undecaprenyl-diphosphatase